MKPWKTPVLAFAFTALVTGATIAAPQMIDGGNREAQVDDLTCRIDSFDPSTIAHFLSSKSVTVYRSEQVLDFDEFAKLCSAVDSSGAVTRMRAAIAGDPAAAKWFKDNGIDPNTVVLMVPMPNDTFELYLQ
ncbi:hypothetical protein DMC47_16480 [Nostoc sp. 3335mG]|nr:hypothetical protein DMC47_16480 [Nostoc sp. 3335mG]